jgi:L-lysine 2,3-aminomutase
MKIIITENQNVLLRRYQVVKDEVLKQMNISNPCYYNDYFDFNKYKSDIIHSSINEVVGDLGIDERSLDHFRNELSSNLNGIIRRYYNKFIKENCRPRW